MMTTPITINDVKRIIVTEDIAFSVSPQKRLMFSYDIGRGRLYWVVEHYTNKRYEHIYNTLEEAIEAYNEL